MMARALRLAIVLNVLLVMSESVTTIQEEKFELSVYFPESNNISMTTVRSYPLHIFAVGTSFECKNYEELGVTLSSKGIMTAIFDYDRSSLFKSDAAYALHIPSVIAQLLELASSRHIRTDKIFLGGHSSGGRACMNWVRTRGKNDVTYSGLSFFDPVDFQSLDITNHLPPNVTALVTYPIQSGCPAFINDENNGKMFYENTIPKNRVVLNPVAPPVSHNSVASSGDIGQAFCFNKVNGFVSTYASQVALFMKN